MEGYTRLYKMVSGFTTARYAHLMADPMHKAADDIVGNMLGG